MRYFKLVRNQIIVLSIGMVLLGCSPAQTPVSQAPLLNVPFVPDISINEIMVGQVDHAASYLLSMGAAQGAQSAGGEWQEAEHYAIQLISSTSAITMGGSGENDAMWVVQSGWRQYTAQLNDASVAVLQAARNEDRGALSVATQRLAASCDDCHSQYKPEVPTQGFYRRH